tara:strand:+ start:167 stop:1132 length:966 start_codon:yes stop_codon:yes gene_type:complete
MELFIAILIFLTVLIFYIHIVFHMKTCSDLQIFEIDEVVSKSKFEDILNMKQPVVFEFFNELISNFNESLLYTHPHLDVYIRKCNDDDIMLTPIESAKAATLFKSKDFYISEGNSKFLIGSNRLKDVNGCDGYLRPYMMSSSIYDVITGNKNATTLLKYDTHFRNFFVVTSGRVDIKIMPPVSKELLAHQDDYEFFLFYSKVNPWHIQDKYKDQFSRVKHIDVSLEKGQIIYIPPYWYYSMKLAEDSTFIVSMKYNTVMNEVATIPDKVMYFLQNQNLTYKIAKEKVVKDNQPSMSTEITDLTLPADTTAHTLIKDQPIIT